MIKLKDIESPTIITKLVTTGDDSQSVFEGSPPINGLACILDNPHIVRDSKSHIQEVIQDTDMLFVATSLTEPKVVDLALKISKVAYSLDILTIIVALTPEHPDLTDLRTEEHHARVLLESHRGTLLVVPMDSDRCSVPVGDGPNHKTDYAPAVVAVKAVTESITILGIVCLDFAEVRDVMSEKGVAMMGTGWSVGENRAKKAATNALASLSRQDASLIDAKGALINIAAGLDFLIVELDDIRTTINENCSETAVVVVGAPLDPKMEGIHVTIVAAALD